MPPRLLVPLAWTNLVLHGAGLVLALAGMRRGTAVFPTAERMAWVAASRAWQLGWATWALCAIALVAFLATCARALGDPPGARLAVTVATAGAAVDLLCDGMYIAVLPAVAARGPFAEPLYLALHHLGLVGGAVVANGAYTLGALALTLAAKGRVPPLVTYFGYAVVLFGALMVVAGFTAVPRHLELVTGPTMGTYCIWALLLARALSRPAVTA